MSKNNKTDTKLLEAPDVARALPEGIHARMLHAGPQYSQKG